MAGESIFLTTYQSTKDNAEIAFGSSFPGKFYLSNFRKGKFYHSEKCFLAAEDTIQLEPYFHKRLGKWIFLEERIYLAKSKWTWNCFLGN